MNDQFVYNYRQIGIIKLVVSENSKVGGAMEFLVGEAECELVSTAHGGLRIIEASSKSDAIRMYKSHVSVNDPDLKISLFEGFHAQFMFETEKERIHFVRTQEVLTSPAMFQIRVRAYFEGHQDLADEYLKMYFGDKNYTMEETVFRKIAHFIIVDKNDYAKVHAIQINKIKNVRF